MKKRLCILVIAVLLLSTQVVFAAGVKTVKQYEENEFVDINTHWGKEYIVSCYEWGLLSGKGNGAFDPNGNLSVAEAVTISARVHDITHGGDGVFPSDGATWYESAVNYATKKGIITTFDNYARPATRAELAGMLGKTLDSYKTINHITTLPDVGPATLNYKEILTLYNAGILTGSDAYGSFHPDDSISRGEIAAIICRLVDKDTRKSLTLEEMPRGELPAYASTTMLWVGDIPITGLVKIGGEYYLPLEILKPDQFFRSSELGVVCENYSLDGFGWNMRFEANNVDADVSYIMPRTLMKDNMMIGTATPDDMALTVCGYSVEDEIYTFAGNYPMIRLKALEQFLGYAETARGIEIFAENKTTKTITVEEDLWGNAVSSLVKSNPYDTARAIHDYMVNRLTYGYEDTTQYKEPLNITYATSTGICQQYADTYKALMTQAGIPCNFIEGMAGGQRHGWNEVFINGKWSYVDVTWDDPIGTPTLLHSYFMADTDRMMRNHFWYGDDYSFPKEYDPAWANIDLNNVETSEEYRKAIIAQINQGNTHFVIKVTNSAAYGGNGVLYSSALTRWWESLRTNYNSALGGYEYTVTYWD